MAARGAPILDLPTEILDQIFSYLSWSPMHSLIPWCPDIVSISLSCRTLRSAVLPTLFHSVRLRLRWVDGAIAEPGLLTLRRKAPLIAKLIRCVYIKTEYGQDSATRSTPLTLPLAMDNWIASVAALDADSRVDVAHYERIQEIASDLCTPAAMTGTQAHTPVSAEEVARIVFSAVGSNSTMPARDGGETTMVAPTEVSLGQEASLYPGSIREPHGTYREEGEDGEHGARKRRLQLDAFVACMVSLPPQMHTLIFEAVPVDHQDRLQHAFALQVCAMAFRIFASRLSSLTMMSKSLEAGRRIPTGVLATGDDLVNSMTPVIPELRSLESLTLASTSGISDRLGRNSLDAMRASQWHVEPLCSNVKHLSLCKITDKRNHLFELISGFTSLTDLTISDVKMGHPGNRNLMQASRMWGPEDALWLLFLISLRLHSPALRFHLSALRQWNEPEMLPESAVKWLLAEAVPIGANVDFERETRLTEDFVSFVPALWTADNSDRGKLAREDKAIGKLVDEAFSSRWQTFAHLR